jgi:hypothetical protein
MVPDQSNLAGRFLSTALFVYILETDFGFSVPLNKLSGCKVYEKCLLHRCLMFMYMYAVEFPFLPHLHELRSYFNFWETGFPLC